MGKFRMTFAPESLYQLAQIKVCQMLWTQPQIRELLETKLTEFAKQRRRFEAYQCTLMEEPRPFLDPDDQVLNQVFHNVDVLSSDLEIRNNLKIVAKDMSLVIRNWLDSSELHGSWFVDLEDMVDHIRWSSDGDIDSVETLRSVYYSRIWPDDNKYNWYTVTQYCLEDCIIDYFETIKDGTSVVSLHDTTTRGGILQLYWGLRMQNRVEDFPEEFKSRSFVYGYEYQESESVVFNLLEFAVIYHNYPAIKYFWERVTDYEKRKMLDRILRLIKTSKMEPEIVLFFWQPALDWGVDEFFVHILENPDVMCGLYIWPRKILLRRTLEASWPQLSDSDLETMALKICNSMYWCSDRSKLRFSTDVTRETARFTFLEIWRRIVLDYKKAMGTIDYVYIWALSDCFETLSCVVNDPGLESQREQIIEVMVCGFRSCGEDWKPRDSTGVMEKICDVILRSEEERVAFKERLRLDEAWSL